jgi:2-haloacid dehalogenase
MSPNSRRTFLVTGAASAAIASFAQPQATPAPRTHSSPTSALFFDIFGTVVDWRGGVARESRAILRPLGVDIDWLKFADAWRAQYQPAMAEVRAGRAPFARLDVLHRRMLGSILPEFGLEKLDEATLASLTLSWHRLDAWDDAQRCLPRLRSRFLLAPVSNGNISLMVDVARRNNIWWDAILGAEIAGDYKPKPRVYLAAAESLGIAPDQCTMVAAHSGDLKAAKALGLRTAHVARPDEAPGMESAPSIPVDIAVKSFDELAEKLGV